MQTHDYWLIAAFSYSYWFLPHGSAAICTEPWKASVPG